jgi:hypothetical protein
MFLECSIPNPLTNFINVNFYQYRKGFDSKLQEEVHLLL